MFSKISIYPSLVLSVCDALLLAFLSPCKLFKTTVAYLNTLGYHSLLLFCCLLVIVLSVQHSTT